MARAVDPAFWRGKRVLLTGHTGFKGAWASILLSRMGAEVFGLSLPPEEPSLYSQARIKELLAGEILADIGALAPVVQAFSGFQPEIVIHFAAQSLVRAAFHDPVETFSANLMGSVHMLEAARRSESVRCMFMATTDKVYLNLEQGAPFKEADPLGGFEPYGASKAAAEVAISSYRASYFEPRGVPVLVGRAGNVIGGGDWSKDRIIPDMVRAVMAKTPVSVRNPQATRPWQWVLDAVEGYLLLVEEKYAGVPAADDPADLAWNFGPPNDADMVRVEQLCRWVKEAWPEKFDWRVEADTVGAVESGLLLLDPGKALRDLGWAPQLTAHQAVLKSLDWYARYMAGEDPRAISMDHVLSRFPHLA